MQSRDTMGRVRRYLHEAMNPPGHIPGPPVDPATFERRGRYVVRAVIIWAAIAIVIVAFTPSGWRGYASVACLVGAAITACVIEWLIPEPK